MAGKSYLVVGISGATNSGKTSLGSRLVRNIPGSELMCQDHYYLEPGDPRIEYLNGYQNWDAFSALDMDKMVLDVERWISQHQGPNPSKTVSVLIVEGFLIYNWQSLSSLFDQKYFLNITKEISAERRKQRCYNPPDTPGYFDLVVWPSYLNYLAALQPQEDIDYIDGCNSLEAIEQQILSKIKDSLQQQELERKTGEH